MFIQYTFAFVMASGAVAPETQLTELLGAIHGLTVASGPDTESKAARICASPAVYLPLLSQWLDPQFFGNSKDPLMQHRVFNALDLAVHYCGKAGRDLVATRLKETRIIRDSKLKSLQSIFPKAANHSKHVAQARALKQHVDTLVSFERRALLTFRHAKASTLVADLASRAASDSLLSLEMVQYFIAAAPKNKTVAAELLKLQKMTRSRVLDRAIATYLSL